MSIRILFADDSVTAQNMGKRILTEAGYDVVVVSNGAAAVKKIAEQKPDIIILDIYMPGYTGLEVCEKVRGSVETLKTPVLLTVGKLEPFKPEEANRVRADYVIVKPFEASDLLAIMKKFEERLGHVAAARPLVQRSMAGDRLNAADSAEHPEHTMSLKTAQATVQVPDHMDTASAFSDRLGSDPTEGGPLNANQSGPGLEMAPRSDAYSAPIPDYELPVSRRKDVDSIIQSTIAAPTGDVLIPREPYLQESDAETTHNKLVDTREPGLVPTIEGASTPAMQGTSENTGTATHEAKPRLVEAPASELAPRPRLVARTAGTQDLEAIETKISESDFEARVAAGIPYNQAIARDSAGTGAENSGLETSAVPRRTLWPLEKSVGVRNSEALPSRSGQLSAADAKPSIGAPTPSTENTSGRNVSASENAKRSLFAHVQEAAASAGAATGSDHNTIAEAVHRVMERLTPELVDEIVKELKAKK